MRYWIVFWICNTLLIQGYAQHDRENRKPKIVGQNPVSANEEQALTIKLRDLIVRDHDDWFYPFGFTLQVYEGVNYTLSNQTITPVANFYGTLSVPVTVHDGKDYSDKFNLQVTINNINDPPVITAQNGPIITEEDQAVQIQFSNVVVADPDNSYPSGFNLFVHPSGSNQYSVSGTRVTPAKGFVGNLSVPVQVNDGSLSSNIFTLSIGVKSVNKSPVITGNTSLSVPEEGALAIELKHLTVEDPDNTYPSGFRLTVVPGKNYSVKNNTTITPQKDFYGNLPVTVTVHDGTSESAPYLMPIRVMPVNDTPVIIKLNTQPLGYQIGQGPVQLASEFEVIDADNDTLARAEIGFKTETYRLGIDELALPATSKIKGTFDIQRGLLTLQGLATAAEYTEAVKSVRYNYMVIGEPLKETKTVFFRVSDGALMSEAKERDITTTDVIVKLNIPSAFTPNGDSANDTWRIQPVKQQDGEADAVVRIYNRFGKLLFETTGFEKEWDGRLNGELLPADTYYYTIEFGRQYASSSVKGIVAILR